MQLARASFLLGLATAVPSKGQAAGKRCKYGKPSEVWVQICIFQNPGATYAEVKQMIASARQRPPARRSRRQDLDYRTRPAASLPAPSGPQLTVDLAKRAGSDAALNLTYPGDFKLMKSEAQDGCQASAAGQSALGKQALAFWVERFWFSSWWYWIVSSNVEKEGRMFEAVISFVSVWDVSQV
ncbi:hypothetical protein C8A03DRAFT_33734 [Achaetomium macrosporum]|uniref:Uncharacterized protein n=1 Tax=Achaetomium macrosporum TaxID=79813 RepID=A0AAN7HFH5_9PEZI|nr:hypothetical protein C8A03DRAFT_33734 [Achaetomium macrosporum]